jgi:hypothetical protein
MSEEREAARRWLAGRGVTRRADGAWADPGHPEEPQTDNDIAHSWTFPALRDPELDGAGRARLGLGLLVLLQDYWVAQELRTAVTDPDAGLPAGPLWDGYRRLLEAEDAAACEPVRYSLWVGWFEDPGTVESAFAEVLGADAFRLPTTPDPALLRRARRVLEVSGPVPWRIKLPSYQKALRVRALHPALFTGILRSYHDVYGDLDPRSALVLLKRLRLPAGTEQLPALRTVLEAGHRNHHKAPDAWQAATAAVS